MTDLSIDQVRERARESHEDNHEDPIQRIVAVLIMIVTILAAGTAYLQTQAGTRESTANREAQESSVATMAALVESNRNFSVQSVTASMPNDLGWLRYYSGLSAAAGGASATFALALTGAYDDASKAMQNKVNRLFEGRYRAANGSFDYNRFYEDQQKPGYRASELQKAAAKERDGWSAKRGRYITVITIFAVALFLLGLTLTVPPSARKPFLWMGSAVAAAAAIWGVFVFAGSVPKPSETAIEAYVEGAAKLDVAPLETAARQPQAYRTAVEHLTRAIDANKGYREAYVQRGGAYFHLDFLNAKGPKGSELARADWRRSLQLDPNDYVSWGDLGAAEFWLNDYQAALSANVRALGLKPDEPTFILNQAVYLIVTRKKDEYHRQLQHVQAVFSGIPSWLRHDVIGRYQDVIVLGERYRPQIAPQIETFNQDVLRVDHQIEVSKRLYGSSTPPRTSAKVGALGFELAGDRKLLKISFDYTGVKPTDTLLYETYVDGKKNDAFSVAPRPWSKTTFKTPDGGIVVSLTRGAGWKAGTRVRLEVFIDGNLLSAGTYTVA